MPLHTIGTPLGQIEDERSRLALAGEAADAAWRAWRYPPGNRTVAARRQPLLDLARVPPAEREKQAEAAWTSVLLRDERGLP